MKVEVLPWLMSNAGKIETALIAQRDSMISYAKDSPIRLPLTDLRLCEAILREEVPLPPGFEVATATIMTQGHKWPTPHHIGKKGLEVLDYLAGQFFTQEIERVSGTFIMLARAPQLLHILSREVVALYGTVNKIHKALDIEYIF